MKKFLVWILCLSFILILVGCNSDKKATKSIQSTNEKQTLEAVSKNSNNSIQATNEQNNVDEKKEKDKNSVSKKTPAVKSNVKLYEGTYWDERCLGDNDLELKNYCEVVISNVTSISFDFIVYEVDKISKKRKVIFLKNTAAFTGDGMKATFNGNNYTLNFTFPSITEIQISGFNPLEGKIYLNNKIPGHECS